MIAGAHMRPSGPSQRIITPPSRKVRVPSTNQSRNQNSQTPRIPQEKQKNERTEYVSIVLSHHPRQRRWHHRIPKHIEGRRMVELQTMARDGRMSQLGSCYPNGGDEPNTSSSLPIRLHPGHGNSLQAPSAPVTTPLIRVDLTCVLHGAGFAKTFGIAPIPDSHP